MFRKNKSKPQNEVPEYITYIRNHPNFNISEEELTKLVKDNPKRPYRDLIWLRFNQLSQEYMTHLKLGAYRDNCYNMSVFLMEEKRYKDALCMLAEVFFYDVNWSKTPSVAPAFSKNFAKIQSLAQMDPEQLRDMVLKRVSSLQNFQNNYTPEEVTGIILAYCLGRTDVADGILNKKAKQK